MTTLILMMTRSPVGLLSIGILMLTTSGISACTPSATPPTSDPVESTDLAGTESLSVEVGSPKGESTPDPGREAFVATDLPEGERVGTDPEAIAQALYTAKEPMEGFYAETLESISVTPDQTVVIFTRLGLPDDSVAGIRYRLEFVAQGEQWELVWVGQQFTCREGRGQQDWDTTLCS